MSRFRCCLLTALSSQCAEDRDAMDHRGNATVGRRGGRGGGARGVAAKWGQQSPQHTLHDVWRELFASWAVPRRVEAEAVATAAMHRVASRFTAAHQQRGARDHGDLRSWLRTRADGISGAYVPRTGDLFGDTATGRDWQWLADPVDRLTRFAADADNPPARRREANSTVELFLRRDKDAVARTALQPPDLRCIGMLMRVPLSAA